MEFVLNVVLDFTLITENALNSILNVLNSTLTAKSAKDATVDILYCKENARSLK